MKQPAAPALVRAIGAIALVVLIVVGVPWGLVRVARARFGGWAPWSGVDPPSQWTIDGVGGALGDRMSESLVTDVVLRVSLTVLWVAVTVIAATVVAEVIHQVRHDGIGLPSIRGLGWGQPLARYIATGLLVVTPLLGTSRASASAGAALPERSAAVAMVVDTPASAHARHEPVTTPDGSLLRERHRPVAPPTTTDDTVVEYVVAKGDSVYGIAERLAPGARSTTAEMAERILDLNLGATMSDGQRFTNAAYIEAGWTLRVPATNLPTPSSVAVHEVVPGDTLWSIADDHLGDEQRWSDIWEANAGRPMGNGRSFDDPHLIVPGWQLDVPSTAAATPDESAPSDPEPDVSVTDPEPEPEPGEPAVPDQPAVTVGAPVTDPTPIPPPDRHLAGTSSPASAASTTPSTSTPSSSTSSTSTSSTSTSTSTSTTVAVGGDHGGGGGDVTDDRVPAPGSTPIGLGQAVMVAAGLMSLVGVVRNRRLRAARPRARVPEPRSRPAELERTLRSVDAAERLLRVDLALRCAASVIAERDRQVLTALVDHGGSVELQLTGPCELPSPWEGRSTRWVLPGHVAIDDLAPIARTTGAPCLALVQLGITPDSRDLFVDLEAMGSLSVDAPVDLADGVVTAMATTLGSSVFAEVARLINVGLDPAAFVAHRHVEHCESLAEALELADGVIGSTRAMTDPTFALRSRMLGGEVWEPAVVLASAAAVAASDDDRPVPVVRPSRGVAVVCAGAPAPRSEPPGAAIVLDDGVWRLETQVGGPGAVPPIEFVPVVVSADDVRAIDELIAEAGAPLLDSEATNPTGDDHPGDPDDDPDPAERSDALDVDSRVDADSCGPDDGPIITFPDADCRADADQTDAARFEEPPWSLMVRLLGPVEVVSASGTAAAFEKSKTRELIAWLATHRERSTRVGARTALWELDVRDETFANVVSAARRTMARLVPPPDGEEWLARTNTSQLPLHTAVVTDAHLVELRLGAARLQPPELAVDTLAPAVELIRGMPFENTSYLWPDAEGLTSNLVLLATSAAAELAAHHLSLGDVEGVFRATGQGLRALAGHEELIALRMRAHAVSGDHAGVRHEWASYERVITSDPWSDGEPAPKLVALRHELLSPPR